MQVLPGLLTKAGSILRGISAAPRAPIAIEGAEQTTASPTPSPSPWADPQNPAGSSFDDSDFLVLRIGSPMASAINSLMQNVYLDEFTVQGAGTFAYVRSFDVTARSAGYGRAYGGLTQPGVAWDFTSGLLHGQMSASANGSMVVLTGYMAPVGVGAGTLLNSTYPRVVAFVQRQGTMDISTTVLGGEAYNHVPTSAYLYGATANKDASQIYAGFYDPFAGPGLPTYGLAGLGGVGSLVPNPANVSLGTAMAAGGATFTARIIAAILNVSTVDSGELAVGMSVTGVGVTPGSTITAFGTGSGGTGTYVLNVQQTVAADTAMAASSFGKAVTHVVSYMVRDDMDDAPAPVGAQFILFTVDGSSQPRLMCLTCVGGDANPALATGAGAPVLIGDATAEFTGGTAGALTTTLTVSSCTVCALTIGMAISGAGITPGTYISNFGSGTGGTGTYTMSVSNRITTGTAITSGGSMDVARAVAIVSLSRFYVLHAPFSPGAGGGNPKGAVKRYVCGAAGLSPNEPYTCSGSYTITTSRSTFDTGHISLAYVNPYIVLVGRARLCAVRESNFAPNTWTSYQACPNGFSLTTQPWGGAGAEWRGIAPVPRAPFDYLLPVFTASETPTATQTETPTSTETPTPTPSMSEGASQSPTVSDSDTSTPSRSGTLTMTPSRSPSPTPSCSRSGTLSGTLSGTVSGTPSLSGTLSPSQTATLSGTLSPTATGTTSSSATASATPSTTVTASNTPTGTPSNTGTGSSTPTPSPTTTSTVSVGANSESRTPTGTPSATASETPTPTGTGTGSGSRSPTLTPTPTRSTTESGTGTGTGTPTASPSGTGTGTGTSTPSNSATRTGTGTRL
jgi:hypothetical protein